MKNKITWFLALAMVILVAASWFSYQNYAKLADELAANIAKNQLPANAVRMEVVSVSQSDGFYDIQAEYPQFDAADPEFNQKIANQVNGLIEDFKKESKDNFDARNATMPAGQVPSQNPEQPFDFIASWTPGQIGPDYESFIIDVYSFTGGAHGIDRIFAFNYDLKNKKEISISDFLGSQTNLDKLSELAKDQVLSQLEFAGSQTDADLKQMIADGIKPVAENYRNFTFGYGKLTIYFEQYQVAPGAVGTITAAFYKNALELNSIKSDFLNQ